MASARAAKAASQGDTGVGAAPVNAIGCGFEAFKFTLDEDF